MAALILTPFKILGWILKHPRILIIVVVIFFIIIAFRSCSSVLSSNGISKAPSVPNSADYQNISPTVTQAPYVVSTGTRIYYVGKYTDKDNILTLEKYYTYDKNTWIYHDKPLKMDRQYYGLITIGKRGQ